VDATPAAGERDRLDWPWGLELVNGDHCVLQRETLSLEPGQTVDYICEQQGAIFGPVNHGQPIWTVNYLANGDIASSLVEVVTAWS
jgi:hypothetical protein